MAHFGGRPVAAQDADADRRPGPVDVLSEARHGRVEHARSLGSVEREADRAAAEALTDSLIFLAVRS